MDCTLVRELLQEKIHLYFLQLTKGCGQKGCDNPHCATGCGNVQSHNKAAANAIILAKKNAPICVKSPSNGLIKLDKNNSLTSESKADDVAMATSEDEPMDVAGSCDDGMETAENNLEESLVKFPRKGKLFNNF